MNQPLILSSQVGYLPDSSVLVTVGPQASTVGQPTAKSPKNLTTPIVEPENFHDDVLAWGENNDFPTLLSDEIKRNPTLSGAIQNRIDYLFSGGIEYGIEKIVEGKKVWEYIQDPAYDALLTSAHTEQYLSQALHDYVKYRNIFPEIVFSTDKSKAIYVTGQKALHCRWQKQNNKGEILFCYVNANWQLGRTSTSDDTTKVAVLDPLLDDIETIRAERNVHKYIFRPPIASDETYYHLVPWYSVKVSGWLDVSNAIPKFKKSLMERQMWPKFHLEIHQKWLQQKYKDRYTKATAEEMSKIFLEELKHFNEMLHGVNNAGKNIATQVFWDDDAAAFVSAWKITALKAESFSGDYIEDSEEADNHILWAVGEDPTLLGNKKGSGQGSGSGSDKREAFNIDMSTNQRHVSAILAPLYFMRNYNGLNPAVKFRMRAPHLQTLDKVTPAQRQTTPQA